MGPPDTGHITSRVPKTNRRWDVFLSHASEDVDIARRLCGDLETSGWSVFLAARDLPGVIDSADWSQRIDEALDASGVLVLLASPEALEKKWVTYEWRSFHDDILSDRGGWMIPACVRGVSPDGLGRALRRYQVVDLRTANGWPSGMAALVAMLEGYLKRPLSRSGRGVRRRLLSVAGAGVRSVIATTILKALEAELTKEQTTLADCVDLIVGNDVGSFVAARLAQRSTAAQCHDEAVVLLDAIMRRRSFAFPFRSRFSTSTLEERLAASFGIDAPLARAGKAAISTYDLIKGEHRLWTDADEPAEQPTLAQAVAGSMAAPIYFDPVRGRTASGVEFALVDGSIWATDPVRIGLEALRRKFRPTPLVQDVILVSIGCGQVPRAPWKGDVTQLSWIPQLTSILMDSNRSSAHEYVSGVYREVGALENYLRLDPTLAEDENWAMDDVRGINRFVAYAGEWTRRRPDVFRQAAELLAG